VIVRRIYLALNLDFANACIFLWVRVFVGIEMTTMAEAGNQLAGCETRNSDVADMIRRRPDYHTINKFLKGCRPC
jgi:hypothetical protein